MQRHQDVLLLRQLDHIAHFCHKAMNKDREYANNTKKMMIIIHLQCNMKLIRVSRSYLEEIEYMTSYRIACDIYEIIVHFNVYLGDDSVVKAIKMKCIVNEVLVKDKTKKNCIKDVFHVSELLVSLFNC